jgi:NAD dependent epimerase/dehydratase family enzyme
MSWIHVDDLLRALAHIWQEAENSETNAPLKPAYNSLRQKICHN